MRQEEGTQRQTSLRLSEGFDSETAQSDSLQFPMGADMTAKQARAVADHAEHLEKEMFDLLTKRQHWDVLAMKGLCIKWLTAEHNATVEACCKKDCILCNQDIPMDGGVHRYPSTGITNRCHASHLRALLVEEAVGEDSHERTEPSPEVKRG